MRKLINKYTDAVKSDGMKGLVYTYTVCISLAAVFTVLLGAVNFALVSTGYYREKNMTVNDFETVGAEYVDEMTIVNATNDTQLIYTGNVKNLIVKCEFSQEPGEFVCVYNSTADYAFGAHKAVYARQYGDCYVFDFPAATKQIRMDTGVEPSITVAFDEIVINRFSLWEMFGLSAKDLFSLLIIPPAIYFAVDTLIKMSGKVKNKHR